MGCLTHYLPHKFRQIWGGCLTCLTGLGGCLTCLTDLGGCLTCLTDFGGCLTCLTDFGQLFWSAVGWSVGLA